MHFLLWIVAAWIVAGIILSISQVGKPRERTTPAVVAVATLISLLLLAAVIVGGYNS